MDTSSITLASPNGLAVLKGIKGVGPKAIRTLRENYESLGQLQAAVGSPLLQDLLGKRSANSLESLSAMDWQEAIDSATRGFEFADQAGIRVLVESDSAYPALYRELSDAPLILYVRGELRVDIPLVACVGTRRPSEFAHQSAGRISRDFSDNDIGVVSGLALGVDTACHKGALDGSLGYTVAVLANGLDAVYPKDNNDLAERIVGSGGALISEQSFGTQATSYNLVSRDRLQSGISDATVVVQTNVKGGTMHTVRSTLEQSRLLYALVPSESSSNQDEWGGNLLLTNSNGRHISEVLSAKSKYRELLNSEFADDSPALPIQNLPLGSEVVKAIKERFNGRGSRILPGNLQVEQQQFDFGG